VLDEAHKIKNTSAQVSKNCRRVARDPSTRRLILTGTPIMNNLKELWALFDFATSGKVLGTLPR
jgi:SNF2 family DNA or RNA helicase